MSARDNSIVARLYAQLVTRFLAPDNKYTPVRIPPSRTRAAAAIDSAMATALRTYVRQRAAIGVQEIPVTLIINHRREIISSIAKLCEFREITSAGFVWRGGATPLMTSRADISDGADDANEIIHFCILAQHLSNKATSEGARPPASGESETPGVLCARLHAFFLSVLPACENIALCKMVNCCYAGRSD